MTCSTTRQWSCTRSTAHSDVRTVRAVPRPGTVVDNSLYFDLDVSGTNRRRRSNGIIDWPKTT